MSLLAAALAAALLPAAAQEPAASPPAGGGQAADAALLDLSSRLEQAASGEDKEDLSAEEVGQLCRETLMAFAAERSLDGPLKKELKRVNDLCLRFPTPARVPPSVLLVDVAGRLKAEAGGGGACARRSANLVELQWKAGGPLLPTDFALGSLCVSPLQWWLMKGRKGEPARYLKSTPEDVAAGRLPCQTGAEVEGVVTAAGFSHDGDYSFDIGELHLEVTPRWQRKAGLLPKPGQRVRARGWTYFDVFHDGDKDRDSAWELHPVTKVEAVGGP